jgi:signal peptidase II
MLKIIKKKQITNTIFVMIFFFVDRISKLLIIGLADQNEQINITVTSFLNLNLIWNDGIAFGLLSFDENLSYNIVSIIIFMVIIYLAVLLINAEKLGRLALILVLGGALGNFFDRVYYSAVPDFIDFYFNGFHWFIFNVADIFISIGLLCLIYVEIIKKNNDDEKKQ